VPGRSELIDELIAKTPDWRGETVARLREIIHDADPEISEDVKWKRPTNPLGSAVWEHSGMVCVGVILKERVRLSLAEGAGLPDPHKLFNAMLEGNKTRAIDIYEGGEIDEPALAELVRSAVEHNLAKARAKAKPVQARTQGRPS
jgi:hypothetical protein